MLEGFQITLANGFVVSVMFGTGNYCAKRSSGGLEGQCPNAEIAVIHPIHGCEDPAGWCSPENLLQILQDTAGRTVPTPLDWVEDLVTIS